MKERSSLPQVRNPVMALPAAVHLQALPPEARAALRAVLLDLRSAAQVNAQKCWATHKAPMAAYWKVVAVYTGHIAMLLRPRPELCGKVSNGVACSFPKGMGCPDCTVSLHDVPEGS